MMHGCVPGACPLAAQSQPPTAQNQLLEQSLQREIEELKYPPAVSPDEDEELEQ